MRGSGVAKSEAGQGLNMLHTLQLTTRVGIFVDKGQLEIKLLPFFLFFDNLILVHDSFKRLQFPPWNFSRPQYDITYKEVIPELVYGIELFVIGVIGLFTHSRFKRLIKQTRDSLDSQTVLVKLKYFSELNQLLTCMLLISGSAFIILSTDHLTKSMFLNAHKFSADLLICIANFTVVNAWFIMVLIFHPNQGYGIRSTNDPQSDYIFSHTRNGVNADSNMQSGAIFRSYSTSIRENAIGSTLPDKMEHAKPMRPINAHSTVPAPAYSHDTDSFNMQRKHSEQISLSSISTPGGHSYPDTVPFAQAPSNESYISSADVQPTLSQAAGVRLDGGSRSRKENTKNQSDAAVYRQAQEWEDEAAVRLGRAQSPQTWLRQPPRSSSD
ncbi:hypothetical protein NQZ79_g2542 [Umbelopsis isabellina]|nr:hypothetical protein NQZ79_g2542 [Umbelopsis isabellina]